MLPDASIGVEEALSILAWSVDGDRM